VTPLAITTKVTARLASDVHFDWFCVARVSV